MWIDIAIILVVLCIGYGLLLRIEELEEWKRDHEQRRHLR